jgi:hypothetical protein
VSQKQAKQNTQRELEDNPQANTNKKTNTQPSTKNTTPRTSTQRVTPTSNKYTRPKWEKESTMKESNSIQPIEDDTKNESTREQP